MGTPPLLTAAFTHFRVARSGLPYESAGSPEGRALIAASGLFEIPMDVSSEGFQR